MNIISKKSGYFTSYDGTKIYYELRGEGRPIVMAYGIGCLTNHWRFQSKYFSKEYQTIVFDYRAHHKSETPKDPDQLGLEPIAQDIRELLNHLQITKASFWGHSFGVQALVKTYDLYPDHFENLVFVNGFVSDPITNMFGTGFATQLFQLIRSGQEVLPETSSYLWKKLIHNPLSIQLSGLAGGFNLDLTQIKDIQIYARGVASLELNSFISLFEKMIEYDGHDILPKIAVPTLIISGKQDSVTPSEYQYEMHQNIPNSELVSVPYGSHCTQLDMPDYVNLAIEKFLKSHNY